MLSKSTARAFFLIGTAVCLGAFGLLTIDTISRVPAQTNQQELNESAIRGKHLWDSNNCMGCHTLLGEGAYYAPELTKVYERRGPSFVAAMIKNPQAMYPGERKMQQYDFTDEQIADLVEFFKWIGQVDLNGFPPKPQLIQSAVVEQAGSIDPIARKSNRPMVFNQMCIACHSLEGQGGNIGPALDGIGARQSREYIERWLSDPLQVKSDSKMPKLPLSGDQIVELAAFLSQLR